MGVRTAYLEAGPADAPPVLLLHGLGATNASMLPVLADLADDHRVLAPDLPGFGASAAPQAPYNAPWFAAWVEAFQRQTGSRGAVLVGNSLGGRVALECGLAHPRVGARPGAAHPVTRLPAAAPVGAARARRQPRAGPPAAAA